MSTIRKTATVKVMLSHDYCHFEASMDLENDNGVTIEEMDSAKKDCNRLTLKAIEQYKKAKQNAANRTDGQYKMQNFETQCKKILQKSEGDRTVNELAMLKQYEQENWQEQFDSYYDFEDNPDDLPF